MLGADEIRSVVVCHSVFERRPHRGERGVGRHGICGSGLVDVAFSRDLPSGQSVAGLGDPAIFAGKRHAVAVGAVLGADEIRSVVVCHSVFDGRPHRGEGHVPAGHGHGREVELFAGLALPVSECVSGLHRIIGPDDAVSFVAFELICDAVAEIEGDSVQRLPDHLREVSLEQPSSDLSRIRGQCDLGQAVLFVELRVHKFIVIFAERVVVHRADSFLEADGCEGCPVECVIADGRDRSGDDDRCQSAAIAEGGCSDGRDRSGDDDRCQSAAMAEG